MLGSLIRVLILYGLVILAIRLMGKRQVGEMQPSELVTTILISAVAAVPVQDLDIPLSHGVVPILALLACELLLSAAGLKSLRLRRLLTGNPVTVVRDGRFITAAGMGAALDFGLTIVELLKGKEAAKALRKAVIAD